MFCVGPSARFVNARTQATEVIFIKMSNWRETSNLQSWRTQLYLIATVMMKPLFSHCFAARLPWMRTTQPSPLFDLMQLNLWRI